MHNLVARKLLLALTFVAWAGFRTGLSAQDGGQQAPSQRQPNPNQQQNQDLENKTVVVQVTKDNKVKINNEDSSWEGLGPRIEQIFKERAEKVAFVKGDNDIQFQEVARAIDIMRASGIDKVGLITAKLEAGQ